MSAQHPQGKTVNLALQGGGAHGAFAWGVLDRLLEDGRLDVEAISATSAGAMNATVLVSGFVTGGPEGARHALETYWRRVASLALMSPMQPSPWDRLTGDFTLATSPSFTILDMMTRLFSPYQLNPANRNPMRDMLGELVDFDALRTQSPIRLFLCATNVRTGKLRVFRTPEITADCVMASACLPQLFQAVEIDGEAYWDGGYMGNPAIYPLIYEAECRDTVIVQISPIERREIPRTAQEIMNRVNEVSFNSSLMREMRVIAFVNRLLDEGKLGEDDGKRMLMHMIADHDALAALSISSKLNVDWAFLTHLRDIGRARAAAWLDETYDRIGAETTIRLEDYL